MRPSLRLLLAAACVSLAAGVFYATRRPGPAAGWPEAAPAVGPPSASASPPYPAPSLPTFPDPNAPGTTARVFLDPSAFDDGVFPAAAQATDEVRDPASLGEYRRAIAGR